mmetsp:Transcript_15064/g.44658  ORF Transcript_15064/g.44658 Transcript_15064/m.44658 type:complete len:114 (-) Transcript_15064:204-545(-)
MLLMKVQQPFKRLSQPTDHHGFRQRLSSRCSRRDDSLQITVFRIVHDKNEMRRLNEAVTAANQVRVDRGASQQTGFLEGGSPTLFVQPSQIHHFRCAQLRGWTLVFRSGHTEN